MPSRKRNAPPCGFDEDTLIAEAVGDAPPSVRRTARAHVRTCPDYARRLDEYRRLLGGLRSLPVSDARLAAARRKLDAKLERSGRPRLVIGVWKTPLGLLRIGRTDAGVALLEFVSDEGLETTESDARLQRLFSVDTAGPEDAGHAGMSGLMDGLNAYLAGGRQSLDWAVDEALMRSAFQRRVLHATSRIPYGTLATYLGIAHNIGQPKAVRAVAQALRHNPVPIQIPCHRIIGSNGDLTGYGGDKVALKRDILAVEGIPVVESKTGFRVARQRLYTADRASRAFCRPGCRVAAGRPAADRLLVASCVRAKEIGFTPCEVCRPDAEPLSGEAAPRLF